MSFIAKYAKGSKVDKADAQNPAYQYVFKEPKEIEVAEDVATTVTEDVIPPVDAPSTEAPTVPKSNKLTINGLDFDKGKLIEHLRNKSFSATGLNRFVWDKIIDKFETEDNYNSSDALNLSYDNTTQFTPEEVTTRGNYILSEVLKEANPSKFKYNPPAKSDLTPEFYFGKELGLGRNFDPTKDFDGLLALEEGNLEPEWVKDKEGKFTIKKKNDEIVYTKNSSLEKRAALLSSYIDKRLESIANDPDDTKYVGNQLTKDEYKSRLVDAKNHTPELTLHETLGGVKMIFQRAGINIDNYLGNKKEVASTTPAGTPVTNADETSTTSGTSATNTTSTVVSTTNANVVSTTNANVAPITPIVENPKVDASMIFKVKPLGLPEHFTHTNYSRYLEESQENPYIPLSQQWNNWFANKLSNPYDPNTQKESWNEWEKYYKNKNIKYRFTGAPKDLLDIIKSNKEITDFYDYIINSKTNPYKEGTKSYIGWNKDKKYNPYLQGNKAYTYWNNVNNPPSSNEFISTLNNLLVQTTVQPIYGGGGNGSGGGSYSNQHYNSPQQIYNALLNLNQLSKNITFDEWNKNLQSYLKMNPIKKGEQGFKFNPLDWRNNLKNLQENQNFFNSLTNLNTIQPQQSPNATTLEGKMLNFSKNALSKANTSSYQNTSTQPKYDFAFDAWKNNPALYLNNTNFKNMKVDAWKNNPAQYLDYLNKSNQINKVGASNITNQILQHAQGVEGFNFKNNTTPNKVSVDVRGKENLKTNNHLNLGSSATTFLGDALSTLSAIQINNKISNDYKNAMQYQTVAPQQFASSKVYADQSRVNEMAALGNRKPVTSDVSAYYGVKNENNKQLGDYLLKEQQQISDGIRQGRAKVLEVENLRNKENVAVQRANIASKIGFDNNMALMEANKQTKQGDILLDFLKKSGNTVGSYLDEKSAKDQSLLTADYKTKVNRISMEKVAIMQNDALTASEKQKQLQDLDDKETIENKAYFDLINKINSKFWNNSQTTSKIVETTN